MDKLRLLAYRFSLWLESLMSSYDNDITPYTPPVSPNLPDSEVLPANADNTTPLWETPKNAYHSTRVICDKIGLTLQQKDILCACVYQESGFLTNPKPNQNKDKTGKIWSTDYGIVQVNDYYHIGKGKEFASIEEVINNPEKCIRWMVGIMKTTGELTPWASFTSGIYKKWLSTDSPMWLLKVV